MRTTSLLVLAVVLSVASVPAAASAAPGYRFKAEVSVKQSTDWAETFRHPASGNSWCSGEDEVFHLYDLDGGGELRAKGRGRITFRRSGGTIKSTSLKLRGSVLADAEGNVSLKGNPPVQCTVPPPFDQLGRDCNPLLRRPGRLETSLLVAGGRLVLLGGFVPRSGGLCSDASGYTAVASYAGRSKQRRVGALIRNRRVKRITLSASRSKNFGMNDLTAPSDQFEKLTARGSGKASFRVKLTRIR